jgi:hypothetical protein
LTAGVIRKAFSKMRSKLTVDLKKLMFDTVLVTASNITTTDAFLQVTLPEQAHLLQSAWLRVGLHNPADASIASVKSIEGLLTTHLLVRNKRLWNTYTEDFPGVADRGNSITVQDILGLPATTSAAQLVYKVYRVHFVEVTVSILPSLHTWPLRVVCHGQLVPIILAYARQACSSAVSQLFYKVPRVHLGTLLE